MNTPVFTMGAPGVIWPMTMLCCELLGGEPLPPLDEIPLDEGQHRVDAAERERAELEEGEEDARERRRRRRRAKLGRLDRDVRAHPAVLEARRQAGRASS